MKSGVLQKNEKKDEKGVDGIGSDAYSLRHLIEKGCASSRDRESLVLIKI